MERALSIAIGGLLLMFLMLNVASSQSVSPLYFNLVSKDAEAAVTFLQQIKQFPDFNNYKNLFNLDIQKQFTDEEARQKAEIARLEGLLQKNPFARDVLYQLYQLYSQVGNNSKAQQYLKRAQGVDPNVK